MKTVYISNRGDDKNAGTIDKPVYSWKCAKEVQGGNNENTMRFLDRASAIGVKERPIGDKVPRADFSPFMDEVLEALGGDAAKLHQ